MTIKSGNLALQTDCKHFKWNLIHFIVFPVEMIYLVNASHGLYTIKYLAHNFTLNVIHERRRKLPIQFKNGTY